MTSHELAKMLLSLPDGDVCGENGHPIIAFDLTSGNDDIPPITNYVYFLLTQNGLYAYSCPTERSSEST